MLRRARDDHTKHPVAPGHHVDGYARSPGHAISSAARRGRSAMDLAPADLMLVMHDRRPANGYAVGMRRKVGVWGGPCWPGRIGVGRECPARYVHAGATGWSQLTSPAQTAEGGVVCGEGPWRAGVSRETHRKRESGGRHARATSPVASNSALPGSGPGDQPRAKSARRAQDSGSSSPPRATSRATQGRAQDARHEGTARANARRGVEGDTTRCPVRRP